MNPEFESRTPAEPTQNPGGGEDAPPRQAEDSRETVEAFVAGTARAFFTVGLLLVLGSCLLGMFGANLIERPDEPANRLLDFFAPGRRAFTLHAVGLLATFIAALLFMAVSLALSHDLPRGPATATVVSTTAGLLWLACALGLVLIPDHRLRSLPYFALSVVAAGLTLFALRCLVLQSDLPPRDRGNLVQEALAAYEERRRRRRL